MENIPALYLNERKKALIFRRAYTGSSCFRQLKVFSYVKEIGQFLSIGENK